MNNNNLLWILGGVALGLYIFSKSQTNADQTGAVLQNQPVLNPNANNQQAVNDLPRSYRIYPMYVNKDSRVEAKMTI